MVSHPRGSYIVFQFGCEGDISQDEFMYSKIATCMQKCTDRVPKTA